MPRIRSGSKPSSAIVRPSSRAAVPSSGQLISSRGGACVSIRRSYALVACRPMDVDAFWQAREGELEEYARLALRVGVNLEEGQDVTVSCYVEHAPLARAIGRVAYAEGARRVDAAYLDAHLRRARAALAPDEAVAWTPPWAL